MTAEAVDSIVEALLEVPALWLYVFLGAGAAAENVIPPIPSDTFVLLGAFLAAHGGLSLPAVFLCTWIPNTLGSFAVYRLARLYGREFFSTRTGRFLLRPRQLAKLEALYQAHGEKIIFLSRFVPGFRALVPVFAGVAGLKPARTLIPIALSSAIWYVALILLGTVVGRNWDQIVDSFASLNRALLVGALALAAAVAWLWWRTRHRAPGEAEP